MTDKELLEMAAKAAETSHWEYVENDYRDGRKISGFYDPLLEICWNPLLDDGDALRLAVKLQFELDFDYTEGAAVRHSSGIKILDKQYRRAIVRAAAEIGKRIK